MHVKVKGVWYQVVSRHPDHNIYILINGMRVNTDEIEAFDLDD